MASKGNAPFRKKVKDALNGVGGFFAVICAIMVVGSIVAVRNGDAVADNAGQIIFFSGALAAGAFWIASTIKPRKWIAGGGWVAGGQEWKE